jgi:hypothetical protein
VLTDAHKRLCVKVATLGGIKVVTHVAQHMCRECQIVVSVDTLRKALRATWLIQK